MGEEVPAQAGAAPHRRLGGKILGGDGADHPDDPQGHQQAWVDYGAFGVVLILIFYLFRERKVARTVVGSGRRTFAAPSWPAAPKRG